MRSNLLTPMKAATKMGLGMALGQDDGVGLEIGAVGGFFGDGELSACFFKNASDDALRLF